MSSLNSLSKKISRPLHWLAEVLVYVLVILLLSRCTDNCEVTNTYMTYEPVYTSLEELRSSLTTLPAREINSPGRIYYKDDFLYINEPGEGIHVIDNRNPVLPVKLAFISIPGNYDLAAKGDFLYVDSYIDLVVLDISSPNDIKEINRVNGAFESFDIYAGMINPERGIVTDWEETEVIETFDSDCEGGTAIAFAEDAAFSPLSARASSSDLSTGVGGSLAKFTIYDSYLYTINSFEMRLFDISELSSPETGATIPLGWGIETIFPYEDKLFIGAVNGMHIYDNSSPESPQHLSTYEHVNSCDPVVVQDDFAYVTLRSGTECEGFTNQLDIVDISNLRNPQLFKTYEMDNPHGLGIEDNCLFITEGDFGLKFFDTTDLNALELISHEDDLHAIDVIPLNEHLMVIGNDGLKQYAYDCETGDFDELSTIIVTPLL